jgi:hypothetical protein
MNSITTVGAGADEIHAGVGWYNPYFLTDFLIRTVFFSHNKLVNSIFSHNFSTKRTGLKVGGRLTERDSPAPSDTNMILP